MSGVLQKTIRKVLITSKDFKKFWKDDGPFRFGLTSNEYPPVLLEPEEWIFSNDMTSLLKELMQFDKNKMKVVKAEFSEKNKSILRPERLSIWKINHFPEEWNHLEADFFVPEGHLTHDFFDQAGKTQEEMNPQEIEDFFFYCLEKNIQAFGYTLLSPKGKAKSASIHAYLEEWEEDDQEAGII